MSSDVPMQPRITKRERKLHLSYELPHRIHASHICPITAPNGSTVLLYGHDRGLRVLWRGGRRRKRRVNPSKDAPDTIDLISDDEQALDSQQLLRDDLYEPKEEEQDPDCPYPNIIQHLDIEFGGSDTPAAVLHLALPTLNPLAVPSRLFKSTAVVAVALSDGRILLLRIPLPPPADDEKQDLLYALRNEGTLTITDNASIPSDLAIKYFAADHQHSPGIAVDGYFLVATAGQALHIWSVGVADDALVDSQDKAFQKVPLSSPARKVSFHPSSRVAHLLISDDSAAVRIYDPYGGNASGQRPGSSESILQTARKSAASGKWIMAYQATYQALQEELAMSAALARRKKILDAKWILAGKAILVLLEDAEWGVWHLESTSSGGPVEQFAIRGFLGTTGHTEAAEPVKQKKGTLKLAPMTPNTRKAKSVELFTGHSNKQTGAPRGGISVSLTSPRLGQADESVCMWYGNELYSITSMQTFWQRSTNNKGSFGSLYSPGISHITDIRLFHENITSVAHFSAQLSSAGIGQMNTQRDLLISAEHRFIILQALRPPTPSRQLFQQVADRPVSRDQHMLDAGNLDIDGMDRLLDNMAGGGNRSPRKVGFAH